MNTKITNFGTCHFTTPTRYTSYIEPNAFILFKTNFNDYNAFQETSKGEIFFEQAGPREKIFFDSENVNAGIVTCGGLCPGINNVIRGLVMELHFGYKAKRIFGFRYGFYGITQDGMREYNPIELDTNIVSSISSLGGSILGTSRGSAPVNEIVDTLVQKKINMLFCIGGDGTLRGAKSIVEEIAKRKEKISIICVPKTIDNDINYVQKSFGFSTAFAKAGEIIECAHVEASGQLNGIGLVKIMGRHSGFVTVNAALASRKANFVLIPELNFDLYGKGAFLENLKERLLKKKHAVIIVAEGTGQNFFDEKNNKETDASGNIKLKDIGIFLKEEINNYFKEQKIDINLKYIDPSYIIRSIPANAEDSVFCGFLAQNAVHAAMTGRTDMVVGYWNNYFTHLPISIAIEERKVIQPEKSTVWRSLMGSTGQNKDLFFNERKD